MTLAIISHTEHYLNANGQIVGWGATVREINHLTEIFDRIIHIAPLYNEPEKAGLLPYESDRIEFIPLRPSGGGSFFDKLGVLAVAPHNLAIIRKQLKRCDVFQFRAPTGMGVYLIPYLLHCEKHGWFKYAGNWVEQNPPMGYAIQRWYLKRQNKRKVTINGHWPDQKPNQLTFENPCLTEEERQEGLEATRNKDFSGKLDFVFVGRLEDAKGVQRILNVFTKIASDRVGKIHLIGDGPKRQEYENFAKEHKLNNVIFHGFLSRCEINKILSSSHIFLLPSTASEGFPKVIAEAANYGLIPVVSDVSSIGQYIVDGETGFLIGAGDKNLLRQKIENILELNQGILSSLALNSNRISEKFTYEYYNKRIIEEILR